MKFFLLRRLAVLTRLSKRMSSPSVVLLFRRAVYAWLALHSLHLFPVFREIYGKDSYIDPISTDGMGWFEKSLNILWTDQGASLWPLFVAAQIGFLAIAWTRWQPRFVSAVILFLTLNLQNKTYPLLDGGNNLITLMLVYLVAMGIPSGKVVHGFRGRLSVSVSRLGLLLAQLQVCLVYACAGLGKATGSLWPKGVALYYTLNVSEYTHPLAQSLIGDSAFLLTMGSLGTLAFQLAFPTLIWNRGFRPLLLFAGTFLHLNISFVMGLVFFGFAMVVSYIVFHSEEGAARCLRFFAVPRESFLKYKRSRMSFQIGKRHEMA